MSTENLVKNTGDIFPISCYDDFVGKNVPALLSPVVTTNDIHLLNYAVNKNEV